LALDMGWPCWVGVVAEDLDAQRRFYHEVLGLTELAAGPGWVQFDFGEAGVLELVQRSGEPGMTMPATRSDTRSPTLNPRGTVSSLGAGGAHPAAAHASRTSVRMGPPEGRTSQGYLSDMKRLRDLLSHRGDPFSVTNDGRTLWKVRGGWSLRLMGVEGFIQFAEDLAEALLEAGVPREKVPTWPEPQRSGISLTGRPSLPNRDRLG
jgi:catechol 2,3-dioxygenase-like lactoylglutathione lyase family enzyme